MRSVGEVGTVSGRRQLQAGAAASVDRLLGAPSDGSKRAVSSFP